LAGNIGLTSSKIKLLSIFLIWYYLVMVETYRPAVYYKHRQHNFQYFWKYFYQVMSGLKGENLYCMLVTLFQLFILQHEWRWYYKTSRLHSLRSCPIVRFLVFRLIAVLDFSVNLLLVQNYQ